MKCKWNCGNIATHQFLDGSWACSKHHMKCPAKRKEIELKVKDSKSNSHSALMRKLAKKGKRRCYICGEIATTWLGRYKGEDRFCCEPKAKQCPYYHEYMSNIVIKRYEDNPEYLENMREHIKKISSDPAVAEKKREAMLLLHNGECEKCLQFQDNYKNRNTETSGRPKRK